MMRRCARPPDGAVPQLDHVEPREHPDHHALQRLELVLFAGQSRANTLAALGG